jgi:hypothetical protein
MGISLKWHFRTYGKIWRTYGKIWRTYETDLHCDLKYAQQTQSSQYRESERTSFRLKVCPHDLEHTSRDDQAVKPVKRGLIIDPRA